MVLTLTDNEQSRRSIGVLKAYHILRLTKNEVVINHPIAYYEIWRSIIDHPMFYLAAGNRSVTTEISLDSKKLNSIISGSDSNSDSNMPQPKLITVIHNSWLLIQGQPTYG